MTSSLLAGKFRFGKNCWSWPRSRLLRSPRLPRLMFLFLPSRFLVTSNTLLPTIPSAKPTPLSPEGVPSGARAHGTRPTRRSTTTTETARRATVSRPRTSNRGQAACQQVGLLFWLKELQTYRPVGTCLSARRLRRLLSQSFLVRKLKCCPKRRGLLARAGASLRRNPRRG